MIKGGDWREGQGFGAEVTLVGGERRVGKGNWGM